MNLPLRKRRPSPSSAMSSSVLFPSGTISICGLIFPVKIPVVGDIMHCPLIQIAMEKDYFKFKLRNIL